MKNQMDYIRSLVDSVFDDTVEIRRKLHCHPELSEKEENTALLIQKELSALGIPFESNVAGHGVSAVVYGNNKEHGIGIRADMDALPIVEAVDVPFKSQNQGVMHACGHDVHTAILLGTAKVLNQLKDELPGSVRLLFQPSEETIGGAKQMIEAGCLNSPKINSVLGLHVDTATDGGSVEFIAGPMNASSCQFAVTVTGKTCHGAHPNDGIDALLPACTMVSSLQSIITRNIDPAEAALITVGTFHSGVKDNIVSGEAKFTGIIRVLNMKNQEPIKKRLAELCYSTAQAYGAQCTVEFEDSYPTLENDQQLLDWVKESSEEILGKEHVKLSQKPSLGADDFSYFCHGTRGLYYNIGARRPGEEHPYPIHSDHFDPDEECIRAGILSQVAAVFKILQEESKTW